MSATAGTAPPVLHEIKGPSAFGGGWRRFLNLLWLMSTTEFKEHYYGTVFGYLWSLMRPLMVFSVLYVVFSQIFRFGGQVENYAGMLLFNIMLFTFFSEATTRAVDAVVRQENVVRKMQFPRMVIPLAVVLTAFFNLSLNMIAVVVIVLASGVEPTATWALLPVLLLVLVLFTSGVSMLLSSLYVSFRDLLLIWSVLTTVAFYGSPILYPVEIVPSSLRFVLIVNPLAPIFELARKWITDPTAPSLADATGSVAGAVCPFLVIAAACLIGLWVFNRAAPRIAEEL
jgi:ABC-2 type transport system permease protein